MLMENMLSGGIIFGGPAKTARCNQCAGPRQRTLFDWAMKGLLLECCTVSIAVMGSVSGAGLLRICGALEWRGRKRRGL